MYVFEYMSAMCGFLKKAEEGVTPELKACEPPIVHVGNQSQALWKSSKYS